MLPCEPGITKWQVGENEEKSEGNGFQMSCIVIDNQKPGVTKGLKVPFKISKESNQIKQRLNYFNL